MRLLAEPIAASEGALPEESGLELSTEAPENDANLAAAAYLEALDELSSEDLPPSDGPSTPAPLEPPDDEAPAETRSTRDLLLDALAEAEAEAEEEASLPAPRSGPQTRKRTYMFLTDPDAPAEERRGSMRFPLALPAEQIDPDGKLSPVAVTSGSVDALFVKGKPLEVGTELEVEIRLLGNLTRRVSASVVRASGGGYALELEHAPETLSFRGAFLELARQPSLQPPHVRVVLPRRRALTGKRGPGGPSGPTLEEMWSQASKNPDDDDVHQAFIHAGMRQQRLDFVLQRYRESLAGGNRFAQRYLDQVGTILGFYSMPNREESSVVKTSWTPSIRINGLLGGILLLALGGFGAMWLARKAKEHDVGGKVDAMVETVRVYNEEDPEQGDQERLRNTLRKTGWKVEEGRIPERPR